MSRFLPASPAKRTFFLRLPITLLLLFLLWGSFGWPAFTLQGALHRMGRENFTDSGRVVASGSIAPSHPDWNAIDDTNAWAVTYKDGEYCVAKLNRVLGFLWQPSDSSWNFYVHDQQHWDELPYWVWSLQRYDNGEAYESVGLFFLEGAARVEASVYRVPQSLAGGGDVDWDDCELVETYHAARQAEGVWLVQVTTAHSDEDTYFVRHVAYRADGSILYTT